MDIYTQKNTNNLCSKHLEFLPGQATDIEALLTADFIQHIILLGKQIVRSGDTTLLIRFQFSVKKYQQSRLDKTAVRLLFPSAQYWETVKE